MATSRSDVTAFNVMDSHGIAMPGVENKTNEDANPEIDRGILPAAGQVVRAGNRPIIEAPAHGKVAWTANVDLAEAAAIILADEGRFDGATLPRTALKALDLSASAAVATFVPGRTIERRIIADDTLRTIRCGRG